jgi:hypothetical protein
MDNQLITPHSLRPARLAEVVAAAPSLGNPLAVPGDLLVVAALDNDFEPLILLDSDAESVVEAEVEAATPCQM